MNPLILGNVSTKNVCGWGFNRQMLVQPTISRKEKKLTLTVILFEVDNPIRIVAYGSSGVIRSPDFFTFWRAIQMVNQMDTIEEHDLFDTYLACQRNPPVSSNYAIEKIRKKVGTRTYEDILKKPISDAFQDKMMQFLQTNELGFTRQAITEEVRLQTLPWFGEFSQLAIKHPEEKDTDYYIEKNFVIRYERYLADFAKDNTLTRQGFLMWRLEYELMEAVKRGIRESHGVDALFAVAITRALAGISLKHAVHVTSAVMTLKRRPNIIMAMAIDWVSAYFQTGRRPYRTVKEYIALIQNLEKQWDDLEIISLPF